MKKHLGRTLLAAGVVVAVTACATVPSGGRGPRAYGEERFRIYDADGQRVGMAHLLAVFRGVDAVLVGEEHDDSVGHLVEFALLGAAYQAVAQPAGRPLVLSLEMFERDVQPVIDEYLAGLITEDLFLASARPWGRYDTDYRPLVEFARENGIPVVAANAPRRYVNRVSRLGLESLDGLSPDAHALLPPLPYPGPSNRYRAQWDSLMDGAMSRARVRPDRSGEAQAVEAVPDHGRHRRGASAMENVLSAQVLWDAAMGEAVADALDRHPGALVIHYAGVFHVERGTGIPETVPHYRPRTSVLTVVIRPVGDIAAFKPAHRELADFVILTRSRTNG